MIGSNGFDAGRTTARVTRIAGSNFHLQLVNTTNGAVGTVISESGNFQPVAGALRIQAIGAAITCTRDGVGAVSGTTTTTTAGGLGLLGDSSPGAFLSVLAYLIPG